MKQGIFLLILTFLHGSLLAQSIEWEQNYGGSNEEDLQSIQQTSDGGFILGGRSQSADSDVGANNGNYDYWIAKTDALGNLQWEQNFGGSYNEDLCALQETSDGGFILGGRSQSNDGDVGGNKGNYDYWVVKTDALGNLQWEQNYGGNGEDWLHSLQQTSDGGFILGGRSLSGGGDISSNNGNYDYWVVKIDNLGTIQWEQNYGGTAWDELYSVQETSDGGFILGGASNSSNIDVGGNNGGYDYWVIKTDVSGNVQWEKNYGGSVGDFLHSLQETSDGGFILAGQSQSSNGDVGGNYGNWDYWIVKTDASGSIEWEKHFGGIKEEYLYSVQQTTDNGFILGGCSLSYNFDVSGNNGIWDYWIVKTDSLGILEWDRNYGGTNNDYLNIIKQTNDGGFILGGESQSSDLDVGGNNGAYDFWVLKLSAVAPVCDSKPQVTAETGDVYIDNACHGVILTAPDGSCFRLRVQNDGSFSSESVVCPQ